MALRVSIYQIPAHVRSTLVAASMAEGINKVGDWFQIRLTTQFQEPDADVAVFYGFDESMRGIFKAYRAAGKPVVYVDLGYFGRREGGRWTGYHKVSVNARHPTAYFQDVKHPGDRIAKFGIELKPFKRGSHILLAGTSDKGAIVDGFEPEQWERETIALLKAHTSRKIVYRPKPSWKGAKPIDGTVLSPRSIEVVDALYGCHAVVTHHSNVAVDGLILGVPSFCLDGVAKSLSLSDFTKIETPHHPQDRQQFLNDLSYVQFSISEMREGVAWRHLKDENLIQ